ncbi:MAG: sulfatase-like hydrolase/transferase [Acidobacteriota bacterium]
MAALGACGSPQGEAPPSQERPTATGPNVLLISIDTLRADRVGCYGYPREGITPHIDALAAESVRFEELRAPTPWTLPSHAAMLTGVHSYDLGMRHKSSALPYGAATVAEAFFDAGYRTAAFVDSGKGGYLGAERGFDRGFESYEHAPFVKPAPWTKYDMAETADQTIQWLEEAVAAKDGPEEGPKADPFFLFVHSKAVHALPPNTPCLDEHCFPYDKPDPWRFAYLDPADATRVWEDEERGQGQQYLWSLNADFLDGDLDPRAFPEQDIQVLSDLYDEGLRFTDHHIGRIFDTLRQLDLWDDTVIVLTSDHGEAFLEHQLLMHQEVYRNLLHVPLLIKVAGGADDFSSDSASAATDSASSTTDDSGEPASDSAPASPACGETVDALVELTDIAPTLAALAGIPGPKTSEGRILPPAPGADLESLYEPHDSLGYYLFPPTFTYRAFRLERDGYVLIRHNGPGASELGDLYDLRNDPGELSPLPPDTPLRAELAQALRRRLAEEPHFEPRLIKEDEEALKELKTLGYLD